MSKNRPRKNNDSRKIAQRGQSPLRIALLDFLTSKSTRETIESIVVAFTLAFLFRTFEAEAFVIPTGSMAPTLQGRHQDIDCPMCGYAYRVSASQEGAAEDRANERAGPDGRATIVSVDAERRGDGGTERDTGARAGPGERPDEVLIRQ